MEAVRQIKESAWGTRFCPSEVGISYVLQVLRRDLDWRPAVLELLYYRLLGRIPYRRAENTVDRERGMWARIHMPLLVVDELAAKIEVAYVLIYLSQMGTIDEVLSIRDTCGTVLPASPPSDQ
jgi:hypothetical protein